MALETSFTLHAKNPTFFLPPLLVSQIFAPRLSPITFLVVPLTEFYTTMTSIPAFTQSTTLFILICVLSVFHLAVFDFRDNADRRHPRLRLPREGGAHDEAGNVLVHQALRHTSSDHVVMGHHPDTLEVLRRRDLPRLVRQNPRQLLPGHRRGPAEAVSGQSYAG